MSPGTAWAFLLAAGALEIVWVLGLPATRGFTKPAPTAAVLAVMGFSFFFLSQAVKGLPIGTAYAVWTGIGAAGAALFGMIFFREPAGAARLACIALIIAGVAGLKFLHK